MNINPIYSVAYSNVEKLNNYEIIDNKSGGSASIPITGDIVSTNTRTVSDIARKYDVENVSPRDMANMSYELYDSGIISFKQHALLSFQPELSPYFNSTIGKLTNTTAQPDVPRNFLGEWKDRLEQESRDGLPKDMIKNTKEIVSILDNLDTLRSSLVG